SIFVKLLVGVPASVMANIRLLIAALIMSPLVITKYRRELKRINMTDWTFIFIAGLCLAIHFSFWFHSLSLTSVTTSVIIISLQPVLLLVLTAMFFRERLSPGTMISMVIILIGMIVILGTDAKTNEAHLYGNIFAIGATIVIALYSLIGMQVRKRISFITYTFLVYAFGSLSLIFYNVSTSSVSVQYPIHYLVILIALAVVPTFLGHMLFNWSLKWVSASTIAFGNACVPVVATALAYFILDEVVSISHWLGGAIAVFGLFLFVVSTSRKIQVTISEKTPNNL